MGFLMFVLYFQALPNQQTVDYPSFKLVIVGDGGTGNNLSFRGGFDENINSTATCFRG